jgi:hypothetical protein
MLIPVFGDKHVGNLEICAELYQRVKERALIDKLGFSNGDAVEHKQQVDKQTGTQL